MISEQKNMIEVSDLSFGYGDFMLMKNISFSVKEHDIFVIMGGSGCGKSTLLHILTGLKKAAGGRIKIDGKNLWMPDQSLRKDIMTNCGILYQSGCNHSLQTAVQPGQNIIFAPSRENQCPSGCIEFGSHNHIV